MTTRTRVFIDCRIFLAAALLSAVLASKAAATWSIILADTQTHEIGVGSATCLAGFDLAQYLPVIRVGVGAGCAQSLVDTSAANRRRIWTGLRDGLDPQAILQQLILPVNDSQFRRRQYGIVDVLGRAITYTGPGCGQHASGVTGSVGSLVYAIQGNVITGAPVISTMQQAIENTPGGIPEKLMAAMEAARAMGGDGRCSCNVNAPTSCGSPPPSFEKSAHVGFVFISRRGDTNGVCNQTVGCASGTYFLELNVANQQASDPDPVITLRQQFDAWRAGSVGVADAVESRATVTPGGLPAAAGGLATLRIELRDWQGTAAVGATGVTVEHDPLGSSGNSQIGPVASLGGGVFEAQLTLASNAAGVDRFWVRATHGGRTIELMPSPELYVRDLAGDLDGDGDVDMDDVRLLISVFGTISGVGDLDGDGDTDLTDLAILLKIIGKF